MKSYFYGIGKAENSLNRKRKLSRHLKSKTSFFFFSRNKKSMHISEEE